MIILQGILNKLLDLISNKKEDKLEIVETPSYDEYCLKQYRSSVRCMCDYVQDDGEFGVYSSEYMYGRLGIKVLILKI